MTLEINIEDLNAEDLAKKVHCISEARLKRFKPLPEVFVWHDDVIPNFPYEIITEDGERFNGFFCQKHNVFYAGGYNKAKLFKFYEIKMFKEVSAK